MCSLWSWIAMGSVAQCFMKLDSGCLAFESSEELLKSGVDFPKSLFLQDCVYYQVTDVWLSLGIT